MDEKEKRKQVYSVLVIALFFLSSVLIVAPSKEVEALTVVTFTSDWYINSPTYYNDTYIVMDDSEIDISTGGSLTLRNCIVEFIDDIPVFNAHWIRLHSTVANQPGGSFIAYDTTIYSEDERGNENLFNTDEGTLKLYDCTIDIVDNVAESYALFNCQHAIAIDIQNTTSTKEFDLTSDTEGHPYIFAQTTTPALAPYLEDFYFMNNKISGEYYFENRYPHKTYIHENTFYVNWTSSSTNSFELYSDWTSFQDNTVICNSTTSTGTLNQLYIYSYNWNDSCELRMNGNYFKTEGYRLSPMPVEISLFSFIGYGGFIGLLEIMNNVFEYNTSVNPKINSICINGYEGAQIDKAKIMNNTFYNWKYGVSYAGASGWGVNTRVFTGNSYINVDYPYTLSAERYQDIIAVDDYYENVVNITGQFPSSWENYGDPLSGFRTGNVLLTSTNYIKTQDGSGVDYVSIRTPEMILDYQYNYDYLLPLQEHFIFPGGSLSLDYDGVCEIFYSLQAQWIHGFDMYLQLEDDGFTDDDYLRFDFWKMDSDLVHFPYISETIYKVEVSLEDLAISNPELFTAEGDWYHVDFDEPLWINDTVANGFNWQSPHPDVINTVYGLSCVFLPDATNGSVHVGYYNHEYVNHYWQWNFTREDVYRWGTAGEMDYIESSDTVNYFLKLYPGPPSEPDNHEYDDVAFRLYSSYEWTNGVTGEINLFYKPDSGHYYDAGGSTYVYEDTGKTYDWPVPLEFLPEYEDGLVGALPYGYIDPDLYIVDYGNYNITMSTTYVDRDKIGVLDVTNNESVPIYFSDGTFSFEFNPTYGVGNEYIVEGVGYDPSVHLYSLIQAIFISLLSLLIVMLILKYLSREMKKVLGDGK